MKRSAFMNWLRRLGPARLLLVPPLLIAAISLPMALGIVPPNGFYGLRTTRSLASAEIWYASNFQAGIAGVVLGLAGAVVVHVIMRMRSISEVARVLLAGATILLVSFGSMFAGLLAT